MTTFEQRDFVVKNVKSRKRRRHWLRQLRRREVAETFQGVQDAFAEVTAFAAAIAAFFSMRSLLRALVENED
jgi:hypothetical protein